MTQIQCALDKGWAYNSILYMYAFPSWEQIIPVRIAGGMFNIITNNGRHSYIVATNSWLVWLQLSHDLIKCYLKTYSNATIQIQQVHTAQYMCLYVKLCCCVTCSNDNIIGQHFTINSLSADSGTQSALLLGISTALFIKHRLGIFKTEVSVCTTGHCFLYKVYLVKNKFPFVEVTYHSHGGYWNN